MKDFQDISGQTDETSHKSTCGRQCDICVEHALIKSHYLFLKSTSVGWEKYPDSCSHKDSQDRKMSEEGTEGSCFRFSVKAPHRCLFPLLSTNHHFSENLFVVHLIMIFCVLASLNVCTVSQGKQHGDSAIDAILMTLVRLSNIQVWTMIHASKDEPGWGKRAGREKEEHDRRHL